MLCYACVCVVVVVGGDSHNPVSLKVDFVSLTSSELPSQLFLVMLGPYISQVR